MKLQPIPQQNQPARKEVAPITMQTSKNTDSRAKAMAAFMGNKPASPTPGTDNNTPVQNQNSIQPEELAAIKPPTTQEALETLQTSDNTVETQTADTQEVTQVEAPKVVQTENPEVIRKYQELAKQERAYRAKQQALIDRENAIKAREEALQPKPAPPAPEPRKFTMDEIKANPLGILGEDLYNEYTQQMLTAPQKDPRAEAAIQRLEQQIKMLEGKLDETDKTYKQNQSEAYETAVKQIQMDITRTVDQDPEFETIKATGSQKDVKDLILKTFEETGVIMSAEEACKEVEDYLLEELTNHATKINKLKQRLGKSTEMSNSQQSKPQTAQTPAQQQKPMTTLTNAAAATRKLSARERALLAFKGELK